MSTERARRRRVQMHVTVVERRMGELATAIRRRSWRDTEFTYDQVLRALEKLRRMEGVTPESERRRLTERAAPMPVATQETADGPTDS